MPSTPQLSDESVLSILDGMSWDDIEEEEGKGQEQEQKPEQTNITLVSPASNFLIAASCLLIPAA